MLREHSGNTLGTLREFCGNKVQTLRDHRNIEGTLLEYCGGAAEILWTDALGAAAEASTPAVRGLR